jgi:GntR family transcriptional regulator of arabinose operon
MRTGSLRMAVSPPLYEKIYHELRADILSGRMAPGSPLLAERELSQRYGVSRITTSRACKMLAEQGLVTRIRGKGTFVATPADLAQHGHGESAALLTPQTLRTSAAEGATLIGYVVPDLLDSYGGHLLGQIEWEVSQKNGYVVTVRTYDDPLLEERAIDRLLQLGVKGLIVFPVNGEYYNPALLRLSLSRFPLVLVDRNLPKIPIPYVTTDNQGAAAVLTQDLIAKGHRKIALLSYPIRGTVPLEERREGFLCALRDSGIAPERDAILEIAQKPRSDRESYSLDDVFEVIREYLGSHGDITAVVTTQYELAVCAFRACASLGIRVPEDLSISTFDGPSHLPLPWAFSHIQQDERRMGRTAVQMLFRLIEGAEIQEIPPVTLAGKYVPGDSTAPAGSCGGEAAG